VQASLGRERFDEPFERESRRRGDEDHVEWAGRTIAAGSDIGPHDPVGTEGAGIVGLSVVADDQVTIRTHNFPANQTFPVRMGKYGTKGIGGIVVGSSDSGKGGVLEFTYTIPAELKGQSRIAIRMDSPAGFYAFNWFWNNTYP
jgi:hypothetical protein